ncbi:hypothetical protein GQ607_016149 [Colletotrichum asianum]|uniref:Uncharacterized protein n=1 Tax=Colletotrichum asianum TaxID=702518 RepID=A0A8H3VWB7_9PEZI|nr:hypothetical protein GQ607_016149 [Colletotrichum asianum]
MQSERRSGKRVQRSSSCRLFSPTSLRCGSLFSSSSPSSPMTISSTYSETEERPRSCARVFVSTVAAAIATAVAATTATVIRLIIALESAQPLSVCRLCSRPPKAPSLSSRSEAHTYQKAGRTKTTSHPHTCKQPPAVSHTGSRAAFTSQPPQESHSSPPPVPRLAAPGLLPQTTLQGPGILRICTSFYL